MKKRVICGITAVVMLAGMLSGCGNETKTDVGTMTSEEIKAYEAKAGGLKLPLDKKGTTLTVLCNTSFTGNSDSVVIKELSRRTGINIELVEIPKATIAEKVKVMVASKDNMTDIFGGGVSEAENNDLGMQGAFAAVNEYVDELPNFKSIFIDNAKELGTEKVMKSKLAPDGNLYSFPGYDCERDVNHGMLYRKDIFDKHGIPAWTNGEEFYQAMRQLKQLYPQSTPFVSKNGVNLFNLLGQSWGLGNNSPGVYFNEETRTWQYASTDQKYKDMLDFLKKMYDEKLLDPEFLTCTQAAWTSKMTQPESAFATFDWIGRLDMFKEQTANTVPDYDLRYAYPIGPTGKVITLSKVSSGICVKKSEKSGLAFRLLDYLLSEGGTELITLGIEGVTYNLSADGKHAEYIGFEPDKAIAITDLEEKYGMFISGVYRRFDKRSCYFNFTEREQEAQDMMRNKQGGGFIPEPPEVVLNDAEKETVSSIDAKVRKAAEEFASKYILTSETGDAAWQKWLGQAQQIGSKQVEEAYNAAQQRYDAQ